ncbi:MAG TPA: hypothetical protein DCX22_01985 [Dehalococcoidia bacterium]|nr:hypothetical protein [Dehalococcoidia bacterium]
MRWTTISLLIFCCFICIIILPACDAKQKQLKELQKTIKVESYEFSDLLGQLHKYVANYQPEVEQKAFGTIELNYIEIKVQCNAATWSWRAGIPLTEGNSLLDNVDKIVQYNPYNILQITDELEEKRSKDFFIQLIYFRNEVDLHTKFVNASPQYMADLINKLQLATTNREVQELCTSSNNFNSIITVIKLASSRITKKEKEYIDTVQGYLLKIEKWNFENLHKYRALNSK